MHGDGIPIRWSAVESILQDNYDVRSDIWMFGHLIHEMFTYGCEPFTDQYSSTTDDIISGVLNIPSKLKICKSNKYVIDEKDQHSDNDDKKLTIFVDI